MSSEGEEGDLGLGRGYRPGGIPLSDSECEVRRGWGVDSPPNSPNRINCNGYSVHNGDGSCDLTATPLPSAGKNGFLLKKTKTIANGRISAKQKRKLFSRNRTYAVAQDICDSDSEENSIRHSLTEAYPRYGDVVLGTSISQQKKLFYQELKELFPVCAPFDQNQGRLPACINSILFIRVHDDDETTYSRSSWHGRTMVAGGGQGSAR